jgi:hypothetical protein
MKEAILILLLALIVSTKQLLLRLSKTSPNPQERNCLYSQTKQRNADEGKGK